MNALRLSSSFSLACKPRPVFKGPMVSRFASNQSGAGGNQQQAPFGYTGHTVFEDYMANGGRIVSEHPNKRGDETVVVEMPDGRRQAFANINPITLQRVLGQQKQGQNMQGQNNIQGQGMQGGQQNQGQSNLQGQGMQGQGMRGGQQQGMQGQNQQGTNQGGRQ